MRIISGIKRGLKLDSPLNNNIRPTADKVKESIFNILFEIENDAIVLDLFSGSGSVGIEFLSRGANRVYFCDNDKNSMDLTISNVTKANFHNKSFFAINDYENSLQYFYNNKIFFDYIFLDPPYHTNYIENVLKFISNNNILKSEGIIIFETDKEIFVYDFKILKIKEYSKTKIYFLER